MPSKDTTVIPASQASLTAPFSPSGEAAFSTIASYPCRIRFWICAACSVTWFSAVVKASAAATVPSATAGAVTFSQLFSIAWRQELPA